jgi:hypothetical protein
LHCLLLATKSLFMATKKVPSFAVREQSIETRQSLEYGRNRVGCRS